MEENYLIFKKFTSQLVCNEVTSILTENKILFLLEKEKQFYDPFFENKDVEDLIVLRLKSNDFEKADDILNKHFENAPLDDEREYYLAAFSNNELIDVLSKPDEWSSYDYQLSLKILDERGIKITADQLASYKKERIIQLSKTKKASQILIFAGYLTSVVLPFIGIIIGWQLAVSKKTLPDGNEAFTYTNSDRKHGETIRLISIIILIATIISKLFHDYLLNKG